MGNEDEAYKEVAIHDMMNRADAGQGSPPPLRCILLKGRTTKAGWKCVLDTTGGIVWKMLSTMSKWRTALGLLQPR